MGKRLLHDVARDRSIEDRGWRTEKRGSLGEFVTRTSGPQQQRQLSRALEWKLVSFSDP